MQSGRVRDHLRCPGRSESGAGVLSAGIELVATTLAPRYLRDIACEVSGTDV
jgi:hypothetical protein